MYPITHCNGHITIEKRGSTSEKRTEVRLPQMGLVNPVREFCQRSRQAEGVRLGVLWNEVHAEPQPWEDVHECGKHVRG